MKHDKIVLLGALAAAMELGDETARQKVIDVYKKVYKNDSCWNLISIDMFANDKNFTEAIKSVNRLHKELGDDYLVSYRASILLEKGDLKKARQDADKAVKLLPDFEQVYWNLFDVVGEQKDFVEYARLLDLLEEKFDYDFGDLKDWEGYDDFINSPQYPKWMKARR